MASEGNDRAISDLAEEIWAKPDDMATDFQERYWKGPLIDGGTRWLGYPCIKSPLDLWVYQEIIFDTRPTLIVETGTCAGGSALYLASMCDLLGQGRVITVDIYPYVGLPDNPRITYYNGDSVSKKMVEKIHRVAKDERVMLILDSSHAYEHVKAELEAYHDIVTPGCYLIVEDTWGELGFGAMRAKDEFLAGNDEFEVDEGCERHLMTFFPGGFLRRKP